MSVNLFMTASSSANYINNGLKTDSYTDLDVIFLSTKGNFPAFNYLRYIGTANDKHGRKLYKINGIKGLYEDLIPLDINELADDLVNDRSIITDDDCRNGGFSLVKRFTTEDYNDPRDELLFDTKLILTNVIGSNQTRYSARFYSISTPFSELDQNGIFSGIIRSPFIKLLSELHIPITSLLKKELEQLFLFKDNTHPEHLETFDIYLFDSALFYVRVPFQLCYEIYDEHIDIFNEENVNELFLFYRPHLDEFINYMKNKFQNNLKLGSLENDKSEKEISGKSETSYLNIIQALKNELLKTGKFENQAILIDYLHNNYSGYAGLSETNLREKFSRANKMK